MFNAANCEDIIGKKIVKVTKECSDASPLLHLDDGTILHISAEEIYLISDESVKYDSKFGDNKICKCGHHYHRHFESYEGMSSVGCKYCHCTSGEFEEFKFDPDVEKQIEELLQKKISQEIIIDYIKKKTGFSSAEAFHLTLNRPDGRKW